MRFLPALIALFIGLHASPAVPAPRPITGRDFVIVVDPGHGGTNAGCRNAQSLAVEKDLTLMVATQLRDRLAERLPDATVVLTRDGDRTLTLSERTALANRVGADVLLSIHANASPGHDQTGFETFVLEPTLAHADAAATAARQEIASGPRQVDPVSTMLAELEYAANRRRSAYLAAAVQRTQAARFPTRLDRGVRQGPFDVLMGAAMPAVLAEIGFLDHAGEGADLLREATRAAVVDGLAEALVEYYRHVVLVG